MPWFSYFTRSLCSAHRTGYITFGFTTLAKNNYPNCQKEKCKNHTHSTFLCSLSIWYGFTFALQRVPFIDLILLTDCRLGVLENILNMSLYWQGQVSVIVTGTCKSMFIRPVYLSVVWVAWCDMEQLCLLSYQRHVILTISGVLWNDTAMPPFFAFSFWMNMHYKWQ
jgi:hypothetical protein